MREVSKSALERAQKTLDVGKTADGINRHSIHHGAIEVTSEWEKEKVAEPAPLLGATKPHSSSFMFKGLFVFSILFFLVALGISAYVFLSGASIVSVKNLDIAIKGPTTISGGEPLSITVAVMNRNSVSLESVDLIVEYPEATKTADGVASDLSRLRTRIGNINSSAALTKEFRSILFGAQNESKQIKVTAEYRVAGSGALFQKSKTYDVVISSSPITLSFGGVSKVGAGQEFDTNISVVSNSTEVIHDVALVLEYPFGFSTTKITPNPSYGQNVFYIGDLNPKAKKNFTIRGFIDARDGEERAIKGKVGVVGKGNQSSIATTITGGGMVYTVERPFIGVDLAIDGKTSSDVSVVPGRSVRANIKWVNNLSERISDAVIEVALSGNMFDKGTVIVDRGVYDSKNKIVRFTGRSNSELAMIAAGATGEASFSFSVPTMAPGSYPQNPIVNMAVSVQGSRIDENATVENVGVSSSRTVKVGTIVELAGYSLHSIGPVTNSGSMPPVAEKETTYTIVWTIKNASNSITNAIIKAQLPPYVIWKNNVVSDADVSFDKVNGTVTWNAGDVTRGAGYTKPDHSVAFQVGLIPAVTQVGSTPVLVNEANFTGVDDFTGGVISTVLNPINVQVSDPGVSSNQAVRAN
jgi:hypothetical protein